MVPSYPAVENGYLVGMLPRQVDAASQLSGGFLQSGEFRVPATDAAALQVSAEALTHLSRAPDPEPLLKGSRVLSPRGAQEAPQTEPHIVERTLEILQPFRRGLRG
jgi:hypothetical protein